jgi:hypothetical protein
MKKKLKKLKKRVKVIERLQHNIQNGTAKKINRNRYF